MSDTRTVQEKFQHFRNAIHDNFFRIFILRFKKEPYARYYQKVMERRIAQDPKSAVGGSWELMGPLQLQRLQSYGLKPDSTLLDIGCGSLRGGIQFIRFLNAGNYVGIDISKEAIEAGKAFLKEEKLEQKEPLLLVNENLEFNMLEGRRFDFIHAQSVFSHMPPEDIQECFRNLHKVAKQGTQFLASFFESKGDTIYPGSRMQNFFYPLSELEKMGEENGLKVERVRDVEDEKRKQKLIRITLAS